MANYIVGDIQGCLDELELLLQQACFSPAEDTLWVAGDLVARGPKSLETLRYIRAMGDAAKVVLGNHDLHLLAVANGVHPVKKKDKTQPVFEAEDGPELLHWLRHQPLLQEHEAFVVAHAGISPMWDLATARAAADEISSLLRGERWLWLIENMYSNMPDQWSPDLSGLDRYRYIINSYTRMRFCHPDGRLDMKCKLPPGEVNNHTLQPWFKLEQRVELGKTVLFGHWAALEGYRSKHIIGLDTGCVWGGTLTMLRWEDQRYFEVQALQY